MPKKYQDPNRYKQLLQRSVAPHEANYIIHLEQKSRCNEENRMLQLLYDPVTRKSAEVILNLEYMQNKSLSEINLYWFLTNSFIPDPVKLYVAAEYRRSQEDYVHWFDYMPDNNESLWYPPEWCERQNMLVYLTNKSYRTSHEERLRLVLVDDILQQFAMDIMTFSSLSIRSPYEQTYLELLFNRRTSYYAKMIADLRFLKNKTLKQHRQLELSENYITLPYAAIIADLEFKPNKSNKELCYLELLLDPLWCRHAAFIVNQEGAFYEDLSPEERDILLDYFLYKITPTGPFARMNNSYMPLSILADRYKLPSNMMLSNFLIFKFPQEENKRMVIQILQLQSDRIIHCFLENRHANTMLREKNINPTQANGIIAYKDRNRPFIVFSIARYFYEKQQTFDEAELDQLVARIIEAMGSVIKYNLHDLVTKTIEEYVAHALLDTHHSASR